MKKLAAAILAIVFSVVFVLLIKQLIGANLEYPNAETEDVICSNRKECDVDSRRKVGYHVGSRFPNVILTDVNGKETKLYELMEGKEEFVINLSTDWCIDCSTEKEELSATYDELQAQNIGVAVIYINLSKDGQERSTSIEQIESYVKDKDFVFPTYIDYQGKYMHDLDITSIPVNFILDKHAVIKAHTEEINMDQLLIDNFSDFGDE